MSDIPKRPPNPPPQKENPIPSPPGRAPLAAAVVLILVGLMFFFALRQRHAREEISYSRFIQTMEEGQIEEVEVVEDMTGAGSIVQGVTTDGSRFKVNISRHDDNILQRLQEHGVHTAVTRQNPLVFTLLSSVLPIVIIFGILYFLFIRQMRSAGNSAMSFGKSRAKMLTRERKKLTFDDVAGIDEAKEEVLEIVDFLKDPKKFQKLGGRIPKGAMLMGPPGTGKTLLAKSIAGEAEVPFFSISGSDFVEMFVGVGASRMRDMFEQGKKNAPCIIFIDEIDAVGRSRFTGIGGGHDEREQTLNALLVEMDGFDTQEGVIIIAATNRPDVLDPALMRPGRFDRRIVLDLPKQEGREQILKIHAKKYKIEDLKDLRRIARGTPGFSGADLENLLNEAALLAARSEKESVALPELEEARDKVLWGREQRSRAMDDKEKEATACHEAGHALTQQLAEHGESLHKVTIIPRGMYMGATMSLPEKERYSERKSKLLDDLVILMGGRTAEEIVFNDVSNGARNDLKTATQIARSMVCDWGMSDRLGPQTFGENQELMFLGRDITRHQDYSQETAHVIDQEVSRLLQHAHDQASAILTRHRDKLDTITRLLLERETLDGRDVANIVEYDRILSLEERDAIDKKNKKGEDKVEERNEEQTVISPEPVHKKKHARPVAPQPVKEPA